MGKYTLSFFSPLNKWILVILVTFQLGYIIVMTLHPDLLACFLKFLRDQDKSETKG